MEVKNVKLSSKLPTLCSFDLHVSGLILRELRLMETSNKKWIAFPSRTYEADGKKKYFAYIAVEQSKQEAFTEKVISLLMPFLSQPIQQGTLFDPNEACPF